MYTYVYKRMELGVLLPTGMALICIRTIHFVKLHDYIKDDGLPATSAAHTNEK